MKVTILDGGRADDPLAVRVLASLQARIPAAEVFPMRELSMGNCVGHFECWTAHPGVCHTADDNRPVARAWATSDLVVVVSPLVFGGFSSVLKRGLDHLIQNLSSGMRSVHGETHHVQRYEHRPRIVAIGLAVRPDPEAEELFASLVRRMAVNFGAPEVGVRIVHPADDADLLLGEALDGGAHAEPVPLPPLEVVDPSDIATPPHRAAVIVGSPRTRTSTSHALGDYVAGRLREAGVETTVLQAYTQLGTAERHARNWAILDEADLVVVAAPLYVDSLPGPVTALLERWAERGTPRTSLAGLINSGFPEPAHGWTAAALLRRFARETGLRWAGGLSIGGGEGMIHGAPLETLGGRGAFYRAGLDAAAAALAEGRPIPAEAQRTAGRSVIPPSLYRLLGSQSFAQQARAAGQRHPGRARPYAA